MKKRIFLASLSVFLLFVSALITWLLMNGYENKRPTAEIYQNGKLLYQIDLNAVTEEYTIRITNDGGVNTVLVKKGEISVCESNCPNQTCVHTGAIKTGNIPIICIPNKLEIRIVDGSTSVDGVAK